MKMHVCFDHKSDWVSLFAWGVLMVLVLFLQLVGLSNHGLLEPDEGRYANMAVEWLEAGEHHWSEPMLSDVGHYDKPPLIYWVTGVSLHLFGLNEFAARLPSALGSLLTLLGTGLLAWQFHGRVAAWWSVLGLSTTLQFWAIGHLLSPDMLMCGCATLGAAFVLRAMPGQSLAWIWWLGGALFWTLAWWTKATASLVPLGALVAALAVTGRRDLIFALRPVRLLFVILLLGSPWYLAMMARHPELLDFFLHRELIGRVVGHPDGRTGFPGFHFLVALGLWLPWWPVLLDEARRRWPGWRSLSFPDKLLRLPWEALVAIFVVVIFSLVSSKLVTYILPGLPWLAIATGAVMGRRMTALASPRPYLCNAIVFCVILVASAFAMPLVESSLGRNSSLRKPISEAKARGATWLVLDDYRPGAEFYFGEAVWYVNVKDIRQVHEALGQEPIKHFVDDVNALRMIRESNHNVWMIQRSKRYEKPEPWVAGWFSQRPQVSEPPLTVGDFRVWRVH